MIRSLRPRVTMLVGVLATMISASAARAQTMGPGGGMGPGPGGPGGEEQKPEGVAEKAPVDPSKVLTPPTMRPWPGEEKKRFEHFTLEGYFRGRTEWMDNYNLGFKDFGSGTPFTQSLTCLAQNQMLMGFPSGCSSSIGTANMRLRLEPVYWVTEKVSVHTQIDLLDNVVLGSTPEGTFYDGSASPSNLPTDAFNGTGAQAPVQSQRNYLNESIRVKRAWAEIMLPLGMLKVGRQPSHWGLGMLTSSGGHDYTHASEDPFYKDEGYCTDCDHGDSVDRAYFTTKIPGTSINAGIGLDWAATGFTAAQTGLFRNRTAGQPYDLDDSDDLSQWVITAAVADKWEDWRDKIAAGKLALNYGLYLLYRTQTNSRSAAAPTGTATAPEANLVSRGLTEYIPDAYFRLGYKHLNLEAEAAFAYGTINHLEDVLAGLPKQTILMGGAVARLNYLLVDDTLNLGVEVGYASGDQWEDPLHQGLTNVQQQPFLPTSATKDDTISAFRFNFDYIVDKILFRRLIGTVSNSTYIKPSLAYHLTDKILFKAAAVISMANVQVSTPGNGLFYGIELDGDLGYRNKDEGFFAGISYGVLFPLDAMNHPVDLFPVTTEQGDASTAQTVQMRVVVKF